MHLVQKSSEPARQAEWTEPVSVETVFLDSTAVELDIHHPVDWVLLRDATRTLMKATLCIRRAGLKERMPQSPEEFMREMNTLCMAMSAQRRQKDSKKQRKRILRSMKKLTKQVGAHAKAHLEALQTRREETALRELPRIIDHNGNAVHDGQNLPGTRHVSRPGARHVTHLRHRAATSLLKRYRSCPE